MGLLPLDYAAGGGVRLFGKRRFFLPGSSGASLFESFTLSIRFLQTFTAHRL
jgi:hypothetical protein